MTDKCGIQTFYLLILSYKRNLVAKKDAVLKNSDNKVAYELNYETSHTRGIDFKSLKMDWGKIILNRVW